MANKKEYTIITSRNGRDTEFTGTIERLANEVFGYTLEIGQSYNPKINRNPTTIRSLLSNLQKSYEKKEACCYERTSVRLKKKPRPLPDEIGRLPIETLGAINARLERSGKPTARRYDMKMTGIKSEFGKGSSQFNSMREVLHVDTGNVKATARIDIRLDNYGQGEASISIWANGGWQEAYTLLSPQGKYGYQESTAHLFEKDRTELLRVLEEILA